MKYTSTLLTLLPEEYASTPDSMEIDRDGNLILSCPNFADQHALPGCLMKIDKDIRVAKWVDVPVRPDTGLACPMGLAFGPDGDLYICDNQAWSGDPELQFKGRILRLRIQDNQIIKTTIVADEMEHPNGCRVRDGYLYVTQSLLTKVSDPSGLLTSCVYRFPLDAENIRVTNTLADQHILCTFITQNPDCQYGADGIVFDPEGRLYVGNFGDGTVYRIIFDKNGHVLENKPWAWDAAQLQSTDGMIMDDQGNIYVADFSANAIAMITRDAQVTRIAQSPDTDGLHGELDQPSEPVIWNGRLVISCFDLVTGPDKVNTAHEMPATMAQIIF
jgi:sugar lactone lactonase YvrE